MEAEAVCEINIPLPHPWFIDVEYIAKQATCVLTLHINAVNGVT